MHIEELKEGDGELVEQSNGSDFSKGILVVFNPKMALVGVGARALFYPTLLYNVVRNMFEPEFHWWDRVDEHLLLGAVPFPTDVPRLRALGVCGVVTLNEPYETLVPTSLYHHHSIDHLVIPTRDYLFAPAMQDINQAINFIHGNSLSGRATYVHCKAGRGRSTTIVLCYLVKYKQMTPEDAYEHVRSVRPRVLLARAQWKAVQDYYFGLTNPKSSSIMDGSSSNKFLGFPARVVPEDLDYSSLVLITESDLDGYQEDTHTSVAINQKSFVEPNLACRVQFARQAAMSRLSCLWIRGQTMQKQSTQTVPAPARNNTTVVDIRVC